MACIRQFASAHWLWLLASWFSRAKINQVASSDTTESVALDSISFCSWRNLFNKGSRKMQKHILTFLLFLDFLFYLPFEHHMDYCTGSISSGYRPLIRPLRHYHHFILFFLAFRWEDNSNFVKFQHYCQWQSI